jgi:hypothetical protein
MYCTHCGEYVSENDNFHDCPIKGHMKRVQNNSILMIYFHLYYQQE